MSLKEENEKLFAKVLELQQEVASLRAEKKVLQENMEDNDALKAAAERWKEARDHEVRRFTVAEARLQEMARVRDALKAIGESITALTAERKGDGWDEWRRRGG